MVKKLPNGNLNFEGIEVGIAQAPINKGSEGRLTLSTPLLDKNPEDMIKFFEDPLSVLELEVMFDAVIISKRVWIAYDYKSANSEMSEGEVPVVIADYECRSITVFEQSVKSKTTRTIQLINSNELVETSQCQGKYTVDMFMICTSDQIPAFTNSAFQTNVSTIFLDVVGDLPSFVIRQAVPFIEDAIKCTSIPKEYDMIFEHHMMCIDDTSARFSIISTPIGFKVDDKIYTISECTPTGIEYNTDVWDTQQSAEIFRTLIRTSFANGDHFHYPIYEKGTNKFKMRRVSTTAKKAAYGDMISYQIPECVTIRFIREPYLHMAITPAIGVFDYKFQGKIKIYYGSSSIDLEVYQFEKSYQECIIDLELPLVIVKVDRDIYDNFYERLPVKYDSALLDGWKWLAEEIRTNDFPRTDRFELLVNDIRDLIIGYW